MVESQEFVNSFAKKKITDGNFECCGFFLCPTKTLEAIGAKNEKNITIGGKFELSRFKILTKTKGIVDYSSWGSSDWFKSFTLRLGQDGGGLASLRNRVFVVFFCNLILLFLLFSVLQL
jgi:hypothetical protein